MSFKGKHSLCTYLTVTSFILTACYSEFASKEVLQPFPQAEEIILYSKYNMAKDQDEIWAINPNNLTSFLTFTGIDLYPRGWSPSNQLWLFTGNQSIYIADANGTNIHSIYSNENYEGFDVFWLTDNLILFNAYKDYFFLPPDIYSLSIDSGIVTQITSTNKDGEFIQNTFPDERTWLRASWTGLVEIVNQNGEAEKFFEDFSIMTDPFIRPSVIQRINKLNSYLIIAKNKEDIDYKLWKVSEGKIPELVFNPEDGGIEYFSISPNEQYLTIVYNALNDTYFYTFNIEDLQLLYKCIHPYKIGKKHFVWSPDSHSVVLHYSESDLGISTQVNSGIEIMDITTCATKVILREDVIQIIDWHFFK